ncbi:hypothetical protein SLS62_001025 [Diatrype stigma]|uniref:Maintenance of telomere capping protein 1 n=1 Tax=Diatrype stigma TaxID=117547 RepID=A0AAN9YWI8_9PEZI
MSAKRTKKPSPTEGGDAEVDNLFEGIGHDSAVKKSTKAKSTASKSRGGDKPEKDILADLENELEDVPSRPHTPRVRDAVSSKRTSTATPPPAAARQSEDRSTNVPRKSVESTRSFHASFTPSATSSELQDAEKKGAVEQEAAASSSSGGGGGGWWGGIFATASATANAAMKQAEAAYKEIQKNEEAKKWAEQVRGNVGALKGLGDDLRHRALPTIADIMHTLAPPISSHERLMIHITHDIVGYPSLDPLIYEVFSRVMSQVEGGDLLVIQRGQESAARRPASASDAAYRKGGSSLNTTTGWRDGPWWRQADAPRHLGAVRGLPEGTKLCRVSAESYAHDYFAARAGGSGGGGGGVAEAQRRALEPVSEDNPVRTSDIFLAVQAITVDANPTLFAGSTAEKAEKEASAVAEDDEPAADAHVCFAVYVLDPIHEIVYSTVSQALPSRWIRWLDAPAPTAAAAAAAAPGAAGAGGGGDSEEEESSEEEDDDEEDDEDGNGRPKPPAAAPKRESGGRAGAGQEEGGLGIPDEIREIIESGGVDPREWVAEWVEEALTLSIGVLAQRYVARRMGVGEGGLGRGKQKVESIVQDGAGEAARAGLL